MRGSGNHLENQRYQAYARAHRMTPEERFQADRKMYPGDVMVGFKLWNRQHLLRWAAERGRAIARRASDPIHLSEQDHRDYDAWLEARYPDNTVR